MGIQLCGSGFTSTFDSIRIRIQIQGLETKQEKFQGRISTNRWYILWQISRNKRATTTNFVFLKILPVPGTYYFCSFSSTGFTSVFFTSWIRIRVLQAGPKHWISIIFQCFGSGTFCPDPDRTFFSEESRSGMAKNLDPWKKNGNKLVQVNNL